MSFEQEIAEVLVNLKRRVERLEIQEISGSGAMQLIAETELAASAATVTFSNIPQIYRDLQLWYQARTNCGAESDIMTIRLNSSSAAEYDYFITEFQNSTTFYYDVRADTGIALGRCEAANSRNNNFTGFLVSIPGYSASLREKWVLSSISGAFGDVSADTDMFNSLFHGRWRSGSPITDITSYPQNGTGISASSIFQLYGVT